MKVKIVLSTRAKCQVKALSITALLLMISSIARVVLIFVQPFAVEEKTGNDPNDYLQTIVDEWNDAPITSIWLSE